MKLSLLLFLFISFGTTAEASLLKEITSIDTNSSKLKWGPCPPIFPKTCEMTVLHGDPAQPNTDILLRATKGTKFVAHTHTSAERMMLLSGEMEVIYKGQEKLILKKGEYAYGPAKLPHQALCLKGPCLLFIGFVEPVDAELYLGDLN